MPATADPAADPGRHLLFLSCPALWPAWPFLPVVRRVGGAEECGLLYDGGPQAGAPWATVYLANLFLLPATVAAFRALPHVTYATPEAVYRAGWRVD